jgi:tRNA-dihydrouridine synthase B
MLQSLVPDKLWLAPLAGFTDRAFRILCKENGADVLVSEMVSADGLIRDGGKTLMLMEFGDYERPFAIQLFGSEPHVMAKAAECTLSFQPDLIDINMGCPVKKVVKRGAGSALMKMPSKAAQIVKEVKQAIAGSVPLSVKFRSGWDQASLNYLDFGLLMQESGADLLCLHPRTTSQMFSGQSNWEHIAQLKEAIDIPLIGNGDISTPEKAAQIYEQTKCDAIMIGRGALGQPWLFSNIKAYTKSGIYQPRTLDMLKSTMLCHLELALKYKPEAVIIKEMRSQLCHYLKGYVGAAQIRMRINRAGNIQEYRDIISKL